MMYNYIYHDIYNYYYIYNYHDIVLVTDPAGPTVSKVQEEQICWTFEDM